MLTTAELQVHVETGKLKGSGKLRTDATADLWSAEVTYARYPGIFELARGDTPTRFHPEGEHGNFLFDLPTQADVEIPEAIGTMLDEAFGKGT
jgi:hypothetical protein